MIKNTLKRALVGLTLVIGGVGVAAAALPGPQQAYLPGLNGYTQIAPHIYTDEPAQSEVLISTLAQAQARVRAFYQEDLPPVRMLLCTTPRCKARSLGAGPVKGRTYNSTLVIVGPKGLNPMILSHELSHVVLHGKEGPMGLWWGVFPAWFDEGLASLVSQDDRLDAGDVAARARMLETRRFSDWGAAVQALGWRGAYGAAMALVEEMVAVDGVEGLRALIDRVSAGADFDAERAALLAQVEPG
ncbi:MAG TPA: hypothetical protein ENK80_03415 [Rhodobacterales bacterium]|nr:hypothetical protein [Rhodobacterales bacterium]